MDSRAMRRLHAVPWAALASLQAPLADAISEILSGTAAERVVDAFLRRHRALGPDGRRAVAEALFGVGLWRRRLAWQVGVEDPLQAAPSALLFVLMRDLADVSEADAAIWSGWSASLPRREPPEDLGVRASLPEWLARHLVEELGSDGAAAFAEAINVPGPVTLRVNPLAFDSAAGLGRAVSSAPTSALTLALSQRERVAASLLSEGVQTVPGRWAPTALRVTGERPNIYGLSAHQQGWFEVQDEGSQLLGALVDAQPGEDILDFCAGAGGKTLQLAAQLGNVGTVHAFDVDLARLSRLEARAARARATCVRVYRARPPASLVVDRVLVDAPCSEIGALRRGPDLRFRIDPAVLRSLPVTQGVILADAAAHVRRGGRLVYATCTLNRSENEAVALAFELAHPEFRRVRPGAGWLDGSFLVGPQLGPHGGPRGSPHPGPLPEGEGVFFKSLPHVHDTDGFFAAVWTRS